MADLKNMNLKALKAYREKLKELKAWAQVKSPKPFQSAISYTLGWLSPELLGTGFHLVEVSDLKMKALIPAHYANLDGNKEISQGLALNASLEMARTFINRHLPETYYHFFSSELKIIKQQSWGKDITLFLILTEGQWDQFFLELQTGKKATLELSIQVEIENLKKMDRLDLKLICEATHLLA